MEKSALNLEKNEQTQQSGLRPLSLMPLFRSVRSVKGVGPKNAELFETLCGTHIKDLLFHIPSSFIDRTYAPPLVKAENGRIGTFEIEILNHIPSFHKSKPYRVRTEDQDGTKLDLVFFHARKGYLEKLLPLGEKKIVSGRIEYFHGIPQMLHPDFIVSPSQREEIIGYETVYPLTAGLSNKVLRKVIQNALKETPDLEEWHDPTLMKQKGWQSFKASLNIIHNPESTDILEPNHPIRERLAYDEILATQMALSLSRYHNVQKNGRSFKASNDLKKKLLKAIPFDLTDAQIRSLKEIQSDMELPRQMLRLLQGDVGSGKTIVCLFASLSVLEAGSQVAIMAPTEILARQHYEGLQEWTDALGLKTAILTGREKGKIRTQILEDLKSGEIDLIFGTHALFQDGVEFKDLGFIVIDEQHRFGVEQRLKLASKGNHPDMLVMTATPIPRTLSLTVFGDMDVSRLDGKPPGRMPIDTKLINLERLNSLVDSLHKKIDQDERIYWICPLVEESEKLDLAAAEDRYQDLKKIFGDDKVGLIHGKMKGDEKDAAMQAFKEGKIKLLVSTTVIEVGVNVREATIMIIEHAERFGLSQLHQLRGRVGRGTKASTCILLYPPHVGEIAKKRMSYMRDSNDGFYLAEKDLELRGSGDVLGTKQSGIIDYRVANIFEHRDLIQIAFDDARHFVDKDPYLKTKRGQHLKELLYLFERDKALSYLRSG